MILAAGLDLEYTFLIGVLATVNPCGFVLLPTYLMYFLGMEGARPGTQTAAVSRALAVSAAVASGFFAVFLVIGMLYNAGVSWFLDESPWISIGIGALMVVLGIAMIFGFHLTIGTPKLDVGGKDRTVLSMFLYGVSYAVAPIGCTLPLFISAVLKSVERDGFLTGVLNIAAYGVGRWASPSPR
ncbi:MAG: cytochrome c biogenesis protein CcdA [Ilumatobacteraceae bacterium]